MKIFLLILLLLTPVLTQARTNLDSLFAIWQNETLPSTQRADAYHRYIQQGFQYTQPDSAFMLANVLLQFAEDHQDLETKGVAYQIMGITRALVGKYDQALDYFNNGLLAYRQSGAESGEATSLANISSVYSSRGNFAQALDSLQRSLTIFQKLEDKRHIAGTLNLMADCYSNQGNYPLSLEYYRKSLSISEELKDRKQMLIALNNIGVMYNSQGNGLQALANYQRSVNLAEEIGDLRTTAALLINMGVIYFDQGNYAQALTHYKRSLSIGEEIGYKEAIANSLNNIGEVNLNLARYDSALSYFQRSLSIKEEIGDRKGVASSLQNIGTIYRKQGDYPQALTYYQRSLSIDETIGNKRGTAIAFISMGGLWTETGELGRALDACLQALRLSQEMQTLNEEKDACACLYEAYKRRGHAKAALQYHEQWASLKDSLFNEENTKKFTRLEVSYEYEKQALADSIEFAKAAQIKDLQIAEQEVRLSRARAILLTVFIGLILIGVLAYAIFREKKRSDELLLNILPAETAAELKAKGSAAAREYEKVNILFSDFVGFTQLAERLSASELVAEIDSCFKAFDEIITTYGLEKIKTIGDAYMAAGGLPDPLSASPKDVLHAGLAMQQFVEERKVGRKAAGLPFFEMRVGIHTGPVIAGVVGVKKFQYDVWGDTVNIAARMEQNGEVGKVNISSRTYHSLQDAPNFEFTARGAIEVKGKGMMEMYFVRTIESKIANA